MIMRVANFAWLLLILQTDDHVVSAFEFSSKSVATNMKNEDLTFSKTFAEENASGGVLKSRRDVFRSAGMAAATAGGSLLLPNNNMIANAATDIINPVVNLPGTNVKFPLVSFGLQVYDDDTAYKLTTMALEVGYRNFFASVLAKNQKGFAKAVRDSNIPRDDLFICGSVVSNRASGYNAAKQETTNGWLANTAIFDKYSNGKIAVLDQIMLDYPGPDKESIRGQWDAFQDMCVDKKLVKTLSVSNFKPFQLDYVLVDNPSLQIKPLVNQLPLNVAYHPPSGMSTVVDQNTKQRNVLVQAWAPLGGSTGRFSSDVKNKLATIGKNYNKSGYQVALRWLVQNGGSYTTSTTKREHFVDNLNIFDFSLTPEEMQTLDTIV
mmetsp:Transcript_15265/g.16946  ORF Transcript_15265/g.16946 Transcript_15265/m.16946 type:complete len:378 (-) Transcript_15265:47-1180(-)